MNDKVYTAPKGGKLVLKGEKSSSSSKDKKKKKHKKRHHDDNDSDTTSKLAKSQKKNHTSQDERAHAGGWITESFEQITGTVFIEFKEFMYLHALDNGLIVMGSPHEPEERPESCELFTAVRIDDKHIALKTAYGDSFTLLQLLLFVFF
jgi:hypothetical protein